MARSKKVANQYMKIRCLLVDDEPIAQDVLESYIERIEVLEMVGKCRSAIEAFTFLQDQRIDLIFLDIQMPQLTGFDFLKTLVNSPKIIITTAYREYAVDSYEFEVLDYLVKPIPFERFMKAIGKITQLKAQENDLAAKDLITQEEPFIFVKEDRKWMRIYLHDIIYLESQRDYVQIVTSDRKIKTRHTLQYFEELLPIKHFVRIHRSFIIAVSKVQAVSDNRIEAGGMELTIGGNYKQAILDRLNIK